MGLERSQENPLSLESIRKITEIGLDSRINLRKGWLCSLYRLRLIIRLAFCRAFFQSQGVSLSADRPDQSRVPGILFDFSS